MYIAVSKKPRKVDRNKSKRYRSRSSRRRTRRAETACTRSSSRSRSRKKPRRRHCGGRQGRSCGVAATASLASSPSAPPRGQIGPEGVRLLGRPEVALDPDMDLLRATLKPSARLARRGPLACRARPARGRPRKSDGRPPRTPAAPRAARGRDLGNRPCDAPSLRSRSAFRGSRRPATTIVIAAGRAIAERAPERRPARLEVVAVRQDVVDAHDVGERRSRSLERMGDVRERLVALRDDALGEHHRRVVEARRPGDEHEVPRDERPRIGSRERRGLPEPRTCDRVIPVTHESPHPRPPRRRH